MARLKIRFGQTFATRLHTLQLKCMQYIIGFGCSISEHLWTMSSTVRDLKTVRWHVSEKEHVLNVMRALPHKNKHWRSFKIIIHIMKTFKLLKKVRNTSKLKKSIWKHMPIPMWHLLPKGVGPRQQALSWPKAQKGSSSPLELKGGFSKKHKA